MPIAGSAMCIEPPRPRFVPASLPISSANIPSGSRPFARQWPWPRCVDVITSAGPSGQHAPTADASCPIDRCTKPGTSPSRYSAATRSSNPRITSIRRCISRRSASREHEPCIVLVGTRRDRDDARADRHPRVLRRCADVTGKRVVITGASRGLGRLLAHVFSQGGAAGRAGGARPRPTSRPSPTSCRDRPSCSAAT